MSQLDRLQPPPPGFAETWFGVLRRRWPWGFAIFALVVGATVALILRTHPIYRAEARLRLGDPPPSTGVSSTSSLLSAFRMGGDPFANDLQLMGSRTLTEQLVDAASLQVALLAPKGWHRDSLLVSLAATRETVKATYDVTWNADGGVNIRRRAPTDSLVGDFPPGAPASFGGITIAFKPRELHFPEQVKIVTQIYGEAVRTNRSRLVAQRASRDANILDLHFDHTDPAIAQQVAEDAIRDFVVLRTSINQRESSETVDSLRRIVDETAQELRSSEAAVESLERNSGIVEPVAQSAALIERYTDALTGLEQARAELNALNAAIARVEAGANAGQTWTALMSYPRFLENPTIGELLAQLTVLEQQRITLAATRTTENDALRTVTEQINQLDRSLRTVAVSFRDGLQGQIPIFEARVQEIDKLLEAAPALTVELGRLQRQVRLLGETYVLAESRLRQEEIRQALTFANVQVIDPAVLRSKPVWPRKTIVLGGGLLLASAFSLLGMIVVDRADRRVRSASELAPLMASPLIAAVTVARQNGRVEGVSISPSEVDALLRRGRLSELGSHLQITSVGFASDADAVAQAIEAAAAATGPTGIAPRITILPPVETRAAAEAAAQHGLPIVVVLRSGGTESRDVARTLSLLAGAGAPVAGGVLLCKSNRDARVAWS